MTVYLDLDVTVAVAAAALAPAEVLVGGVGLGVADVFHHRAGEQIIHLQHEAGLAVERFAGDVA